MTEQPVIQDARQDSEAPQRHLGPVETGIVQKMVLRSAEFRKGREHTWRRLEEMVDRIERHGITDLPAEDVQQLPLLYRAVMSSVSVARNIALDRNLLLYLENLSLRAYLAVYGPRSGVLQNLSSFFRQGFPRAVRGIRWHLAIAFAALAVGAIAGFLLVQADMSYYDILVPDSLADGRGPGSTAEDLRNSELFAPWPGFVETFIVFANSLFRHNALIGILCFGLGFALGVPTMLLLIYNGLIIGAFVALHADKGLAVDCIAWLSIHGVTEILAVLLCGAAGLAVAQQILFPGVLSRLDNLAKFGRQAASIAAGSVLLFFIAGLLEGGFRQLVNNTPGRFAFAAVTAALWLAYFLLAGKGDRYGHTK